MKPVGGRGKKAPYETVQMRVPIPIKPKVEQLIQNYRDEILASESKSRTQNMQNTKPEYRFNDLERVIEQVLADTVVTRNGKDKGAVRRGLEALSKALQG